MKWNGLFHVHEQIKFSCFLFVLLLLWFFFLYRVVDAEKNSPFRIVGSVAYCNLLTLQIAVLSLISIMRPVIVHPTFHFSFSWFFLNSLSLFGEQITFEKLSFISLNEVESNWNKEMGKNWRETKKKKKEITHIGYKLSCKHSYNKYHRR